MALKFVFGAFALATFSVITGNQDIIDWPVRLGHDAWLYCVPEGSVKNHGKRDWVKVTAWYRNEADGTWTWVAGVEKSSSTSEWRGMVADGSRYKMLGNGLLGIQHVSKADNNTMYRCNVISDTERSGRTFLVKLYVMEAKAVQVDGNWSPWNYWSECFTSCGGGQQRRTRSSTNPPAAFGRKPCAGESVESRGCRSKHCPEPGRLQRYKMSSRPRGFCVIINNINFSNKEKRVGAEVDERDLARLFKELQFEVRLFRDLQWYEMRNVSIDFANEDHDQFDAFVFIVMSHGGDKDVIAGVRGRVLRVEDLMSEFKAANCPTLQNKPKLFIFQTCRGSLVESLSPGVYSPDTATAFSPDSTLVKSVCPQEADFLLSFATAPAYKAWRDPKSGSLFIQVLVEEIKKHHDNHHLLDILTEVNRRVVEEGIRLGEAIQCPAPTHTLQGQVFL